MAWLERLNNKAETWPFPIRWTYLLAKWYLIIGGVIVITVHFLYKLGFPVF